MLRLLYQHDSTGGTSIVVDPVVPDHHIRTAKAPVVSSRLSGNSSLILFRNIGDNVRFKCGRRLYRLFFIAFLIFFSFIAFSLLFLDSLFPFGCLFCFLSIMHESDESPNTVDL